MGERRIRTRGFETDLIAAIAASSFRFEDPSLGDLVLTVDRHLFANYVPDEKEIGETSSDFEPLREPALGFYSLPGSGIKPTMSSQSQLQFNVLVTLRVPKTLQDSVDLLRDLTDWLELNGAGMETDHFLIRNYQTLGLPVPYKLHEDNVSAASATVKFLAVAKL